MPVLKKWFALALWKRVFLGLILGLILGLVLRWTLSAEPATQIVETWIKPFGDAFVRLIRMMVTPLITTTLIAGVVGMSNPKRLGSIGARALGLYMLTTFFAVILGLIVGSILRPGQGVVYQNASLDVADALRDKLEAGAQTGGIGQRLLEIIPTNPVEALAQGDVLAIIFFSILLGVGILLSGSSGKPLASFFESAAEAVQKMTLLVMETAPFGVMALMAWVTATQGLSILQNLLLLALSLYIALFLHAVLVYGGLIKLVLKLPLMPFFRGILDAQTVAFSTSSSNATLPVTLSCVRENLGVNRVVAGAVLPLGATVNMDGTTIYLGLIALFAAQALGLDLSMADYVLIALTATLASIGTAGIPSVSLFLAATVLAGIGVTEAQTVMIIAFIFPFDRPLDMGRTVLNITGDAAVACAVAKWDKSLDEKVYVEEDRI